MFIHITLETAPNEMQCDETNNHMVTASQSYFRLQQADRMPILFRVTAGRSYFDLISGYGSNHYNPTRGVTQCHKNASFFLYKVHPHVKWPEKKT